jgi:glycosyltransferase involved in cell wall biosynthesis
MLTIIGIPIGPDTYTTCYYGALQDSGVRVIKGDFSGRWLLANRRGVDYLHLNWPSFIYREDRSAIVSLKKFVRFIFLLVLTRLCGIRLLWTAHNLYPHDRNKIAVFDGLGRKILVSLSYRVFAHGKSAASVVTREFPGVQGKLVIIPHGNWIGFYPDDCSRATARARLNIPAEQYIFLSFGTCKEYKNLEYLIKCFQSGPFGKAALWIVGRFQEAQYAARVKAQIAHQPQRIRLEDRFVPNDELQYYLKACNAIVLAYTDILTSGSAMLAISFGRPVIAPRLGHLLDVVNPDCGILYDPSDDQDLLRAMRDAQGRQFDDAFIRQHARNFEWRDAAMQTISALE